jgi:hypothetical protein
MAPYTFCWDRLTALVTSDLYQVSTCMKTLWMFETFSAPDKCTAAVRGHMCSKAAGNFSTLLRTPPLYLSSATWLKLTEMMLSQPTVQKVAESSVEQPGSVDEEPLAKRVRV